MLIHPELSPDNEVNLDECNYLDSASLTETESSLIVFCRQEIFHKLIKPLSQNNNLDALVISNE